MRTLGHAVARRPGEGYERLFATMRRYAALAWPGAVAFALYAVALSPNVDWWDTAEFQTVPYIAGILHPTGFPAYALAGWLITHALPIGSVAWRMNVLGALCGAIMTDRAAATARNLGAAPATAGVAALLFATSPLVFHEATIALAESLAFAFVALAVCAAVRYARLARGPDVAACAIFAGLALATHPITIWTFPGIILILAGAKITPLRTARRAAVSVAIAAAIVAAIYAYLPLRDGWIVSHHVDPVEQLFPVTNTPFWDYDRPSTREGFVRLVTGAEFGSPGRAVVTTLSADKYAAHGKRLIELLGATLGIPVFLVLALVAFERRVRRWTMVAGVAVAGFLPAAFANIYLTADPGKYDLSVPWAAAVLVAAGATAFLRALRKRSWNTRPLVLALLLGFSAAALRAESAVFSHSTDLRGEHVIETVLRATPDDAIVNAEWVYLTSLAYAAYVDHRFGHRLLAANVSYEMVRGRRLGRRFFYLFPGDLAKAHEPNVAGGCLARIASSPLPLYEVLAPSPRGCPPGTVRPR